MPSNEPVAQTLKDLDLLAGVTVPREHNRTCRHGIGNCTSKKHVHPQPFTQIDIPPEEWLAFKQERS